MKTVEQYVEALQTFAPSPDGKTVRRLYGVVEGLRDVAYARRAFPAVFGLFERYSEAELGSPGPLVHCVEAIGGFHDELAASLRRRPTFHTIYMAKKVLRLAADDAERAPWLGLLRELSARGDLAAAVREQAAQAVAGLAG